MLCRLQSVLIKSVVCMALALPAVRAGDCAPPPCAPAAPAVTYKTVMVEECVPEHYTTTRTVYKLQQVQETYTAYKTVCEPQQQVRNVTTYKVVPTVETRTRQVCNMVPTVENRVCTERHWVCKPVTTYVCKTVDMGHYEERCEPVRQGFFAKWKKKDCCEPCVEYKVKKVWVPCKVTVQEPCTKMVRTCETRQVVRQVTVCKPVHSTETYQVTVNKCIPETKPETITVHVAKCVPFQATRTVCKCVPVQETVTCCRMVKRCVAKQVPVCDPCCN